MLYRTLGQDYRDPSKECVQVWAEVDGEKIGLEEWNDVFLSVATESDLYKFYCKMIDNVADKVRDKIRANTDARMGFGFVS